MNSRRIKGVLRVVGLLSTLAVAGSAMAADQVLDTVAVFGRTSPTGAAVIELNSRVSPARVEATGASGTDFRACKLTAANGLFCLDGKDVVKWSDPKNSVSRSSLFSCEWVPDLDARSSDTCTGLTVDTHGTIWLAGKNKGKTHNLVRVIDRAKWAARPDSASWVEILKPDRTGTGYFARNCATGKPLLVDITAVGGDEADRLQLGGEGILGLQERTKVFFYPQTCANDEVEIGVSGKNGWGLLTKELLQGVTLWQPPGTTTSYALVTTSNGRILAQKMTPTNELPIKVMQLTSSCGALASQYGIRGSSKSGLIYVTDRQCAELKVFQPYTGEGDKAAPDLDGDWNMITTLATATAETGSVAPEGPTIAPGIGINLASAECKSADGCPVTEGAWLRIGNSLASLDKSGLTVFQVKNIPDCRWVNVAACVSGVIVNADGTPGGFDPDPKVAATQYLNVTPLLPTEVTNLFPAPNNLPALLISPQYRGQYRKPDTDPATPESFYFEAFFNVTEPGVRFNGTFEAEYEVVTLAKDSLGSCSPDPANPDATYPLHTATTELLKWDVATRVSEQNIGVGMGHPYDHVDMLINAGCGSIVTKKPGFSLVSYNLEITPHTSYGTEKVIENNDAVFGRLVQKLYADLGRATDELACQPVDVGSGNAPIGPGICSTLHSTWANGKDKLDKCVAATYEPKTSASNQNCQSFLSQFKSFKDTLAIAGPYGDDPANRKGELEVRVDVIQHVYDKRFVPSIPEGGFCVESAIDPATCP